VASKLIELADAVVTLLTSTVTAASGTIARAYVPRYQLEESESVRVVVVPRSEERSRVARGRIQSQHTIDVGVCQRATSDSQADTRMNVADSLAEYLEENELPTATGARVVTVAFQPVWDTDYLVGGLFVSVVRVVYRTLRGT
jgi:hypothetical protein